MTLFAIGDLHLPGGDEKPMNVFGAHWEGHFAHIAQDWRERVTAEDTVLIPGDISWAMQLKNALPDLQAIGELPGQKILLRGNHDYWWSGITQVRSILPEGMRALQNDAMDLGACVVCGSRGWIFPTSATRLKPEDEKIYARELLRMEMSLQAAEKLRRDRPLVMMTHYPPLSDGCRDTAFTALAERYGVNCAVYGHLHGQGVRAAFEGTHNGVRYCLTSCDSLDFKLAQIEL